MDLVYDLFVIVHLLGMAALVGGYLAVAKAPTASPVMLWGARAQIVTGLVLVGLAEGVSSLDKDLNHAKIGLKLVIALGAIACIEIASSRARRGAGEKPDLVKYAGWLGLLNVVVAAGWN